VDSWSDERSRIEVVEHFHYSWRDMAHRIPEINGAAIVLAGSFNPTIFQPEWFLRQKLLPQAEVEAAKILVMVPQVCDFETERFRVQVTPEKFSAISKPTANPVPLRDLVFGTFYVLEHTPAKAIGLNRQMHYPLGSEDEWHKLGDRLAPKEGWRGVLKTGRPGMRALLIETMLDDSGNPDGPKLIVKVEPSAQVKVGVYFETNAHYPAPKDNSMAAVLEVLKTRWEEDYNYAAEISDYILDWAGK
jgi:hypothetical protein